MNGILHQMRSSPRRSRPLLAGALTLLLVGAALAFTGRVQQKMRDFEVYWTAGARAAAAQPLYRASDGHYRFKYLPAFAVAVAPLARLPLGTAKATWFGLSIACLVVLVAVSVAAVPRDRIGAGALAALTVVAMAKFYGHELVLGQANLLFGAICAAALLALLHRREGLAGFLFGVATIVKPYAVVFVPYLLLTRRWLAAVASCLAIACVVLLPVPIFGVSATVRLLGDWWRTASETSVPLLTNADSSSVFAMYAKWFGWSSFAAWLSLATVAVLGCAFLAALARRRSAPSPEVLEVGLLLTFIPLCTPQGWDYVLLLSTPLIALLIARAPAMPRGERWLTIATLAVVAFSIYDVLGRAAYRSFMALSIVTVCYLVLAAVAVRLRLRGAA
jgi:alpha-1,2-mannosyltransferase